MEQYVLVATTATTVILSISLAAVIRRLAHLKREFAIYRSMIALHGHCLDNARDLLIVHHLAYECFEEVHPDDFIWEPLNDLGVTINGNAT